MLSPLSPLITTTGGGLSGEPDIEAERQARHWFTSPEHKATRAFREDLYEGHTLLEMDLTELNVVKLRGIIEEWTRK